MAMFGGARKVFTFSDFPEPEIIDPGSVPSLRWGILGAGDIAELPAVGFEEALALHVHSA